MSKIGEYNREGEGISLEISLEGLVRKIEKMNNGTHRFLSLLVRIRREDQKREICPSCKNLTDGIEKLLNEGYF